MKEGKMYFFKKSHLVQHFIPFSRVSRKRKKTLSLTKYFPYFRIFQNDIMITKESSSLVDSKKDGVTQPPILQLEEPSKGTFFFKSQNIFSDLDHI